MANTGYTKGEWKIDNRTVYSLNTRGTNRFSCHVQEADDDMGRRISDAEVTANAHLIAAAPDMYEALNLVKPGKELNWDIFMLKAKQALAKAEGKDG